MSPGLLRARLQRRDIHGALMTVMVSSAVDDTGSEPVSSSSTATFCYCINACMQYSSAGTITYGAVQYAEDG